MKCYWVKYQITGRGLKGYERKYFESGFDLFQAIKQIY